MPTEALTHLSRSLSRPFGWLLSRYLYRIGPTLSVRTVSASSVLEGASRDVESAPIAGASDPRKLFAVWIADHLSLLAVAFSGAETQIRMDSLTFFVDQSTGGFIVERPLRDKGAAVISLATFSAAARMKSLRAAYSVAGDLVLVVDGGGPYRQVPPSVVNLSKAVRASIVPVAARASRSVTLPNRFGAVHVPLREATITVRLGHAIDPGAYPAPSAAAKYVQTCLGELGGSVTS